MLWHVRETNYLLTSIDCPSHAGRRCALAFDILSYCDRHLISCCAMKLDSRKTEVMTGEKDRAERVGTVGD